jgi:hypothetical protein
MKRFGPRHRNDRLAGRTSSGPVPICVLLVLAGMALPTLGSAQAHDASVGYGGGGVWFGSFADADDLALDPGWIVNAHAEHWLGGRRFGLRAQVAYTQRPFATPFETRDIDSWLAGADLLVRFLPVRPGRSASPYVGAGAGMVRYELGRGPPIVVAEDVVYPGNDERRFAVTAALGLDLLPGWNLFDTPIGVRLELTDHVALTSPLESMGGRRFGPVHNVRLSLGLLGVFDYLR